MKRLLTVIAFCATAFTAAGALTTPAAADSGRHGSGLYTQGPGGGFAFSFTSGERRHGVQRAERRHHKLRRHNRFKRQQARLGHGQRQQARLGHGQRQHVRLRHGQRLGHGRRLGHGGRCHQVRRHGFDRRGYRVLFGGLMCYDAYGSSYVVDGSRTIIRRY